MDSYDIVMMNLVNEQTVPGTRVYHCIVSIKEFIIICGRYQDMNGATYDDLSIYNTISGVWKQLRRQIEQEDIWRDPKICALGNKVFICSVENHYGGVPEISSIVSLDVSYTTWVNLYTNNEEHDDNKPPPMYVSLFFSHNGSLYIMGYSANSYEIDIIYMFCLEKSIWSFVQQIGETPKFYGQMYGTVFKNLYKPTTRYKEVKIFDLLTNSWTIRETSSKNKLYPHGRANESYAFSSNCAYMSGGSTQDLTTYYCDIWRIDFETLKWVKLDYFHKSGIYQHIMSVVNDSYLYNVGGWVQNRRFSTTMERFVIRPSSLYHICLESICRSPNMTKYLKSLPMTIVDELNINNNDSSVND
ncbi:hypothetical protein RF11_14912 [Thelohanellus kitauei]|uniref:Kelch domain-containing protein 10 n=1 Tax=Thelohanellus kitauei TaxID=669202 RepID=A0A0C2J4Q7_THEKT|nr:hypothetical protein RF11_14912 [Thelohanellus kitauei]